MGGHGVCCECREARETRAPRGPPQQSFGRCGVSCVGLCQWNRYGRLPTRSLRFLETKRGRDSDSVFRALKTLSSELHCFRAFRRLLCARDTVLCTAPKSNASQTQPTRREHPLGNQWVRVRGEGVRGRQIAAGRVVTDQRVSGARTWGDASKGTCTRLVDFRLRACHNKLVLRYHRVFRTGRDCRGYFTWACSL